MPKPFNGISGDEMFRIVCHEAQASLALDPRFDRSDPIQQALLTFTLRVDYKSAPADDEQTFTVQCSDLVRAEGLEARHLPARILAAIEATLSRDLRFAINLTYPFVSWNHRLALEVTRADGTRLPEVDVLLPPMTDHRGLVTPADRHVDLRAAVTQPVLSAADAYRQKLQAEIDRLTRALDQASVASSQPPILVEPPVDPLGVFGSLAEPSQPPDDMRITGAWKTLADPTAAVRSSGVGASIGITVGRTPQGQQLGVTPEMVQRTDQIEIQTQHPALAHGGIGSPDQARRDHGLTVPTPTQTRSGLVDLPLGSF